MATAWVGPPLPCTPISFRKRIKPMIALFHVIWQAVIRGMPERGTSKGQLVKYMHCFLMNLLCGKERTIIASTSFKLRFLSKSCHSEISYGGCVAVNCPVNKVYSIILHMYQLAGSSAHGSCYSPSARWWSCERGNLRDLLRARQPGRDRWHPYPSSCKKNI